MFNEQKEEMVKMFGEDAVFGFLELFGEKKNLERKFKKAYHGCYDFDQLVEIVAEDLEKGRPKVFFSFCRSDNKFYLYKHI